MDFAALILDDLAAKIASSRNRPLDVEGLIEIVGDGHTEAFLAELLDRIARADRRMTISLSPEVFHFFEARAKAEGLSVEEEIRFWLEDLYAGRRAA